MRHVLVILPVALSVLAVVAVAVLGVLVASGGSALAGPTGGVGGLAQAGGNPIDLLNTSVFGVAHKIEGAASG